MPDDMSGSPERRKPEMAETKEDLIENLVKEEPLWGTKYTCPSCGYENPGGIQCGGCSEIRVFSENKKENERMKSEMQILQAEYYAAVDAYDEDNDVDPLVDWAARFADQGAINRSVWRRVNRAIRKEKKYDEYLEKREKFEKRKSEKEGARNVIENVDHGGDEGQMRERFLQKMLLEADNDADRFPGRANQIIREINSSDEFEVEAKALTRLLQRSAFKREFMSNPAGFDAALDKYDPDKEQSQRSKVGKFLNGAEMRSDMLVVLERNASSAQKINLVWLELERIPYPKEGIKAKAAEDEMLKIISEKLGVSLYEARIGFLLFESFIEPSVNPAHPLYKLVHPAKATPAYEISQGWRVLGADNALPDHLWMPLGLKRLGGTVLSEEVIKGRGVGVLKNLLEQDAGKVLIENLGQVLNASTILRQLKEIGPGKKKNELSVGSIRKLRFPLTQLAEKGYIDETEAQRILFSAAQVYFWELSPDNPASYMKNEDEAKGLKRLATPAELMGRFLNLAVKEIEFDKDDPTKRNEVGLFQVGSNTGVDKLKKIRDQVKRYMKMFEQMGPEFKKDYMPHSQKRLSNWYERMTEVMPDKYITVDEKDKLWEKSQMDYFFGIPTGKSPWTWPQ